VVQPDCVPGEVDPAGHVWTVATRIEETTAEERTDRWNEILARDQTR
jgi:hypothetical protein